MKIFFASILLVLLGNTAQASLTNACELRDGFREVFLAMFDSIDCNLIEWDIIADMSDLELKLTNLNQLEADDLKNFPSLRTLSLTCVDIEIPSTDIFKSIPILNVLAINVNTSNGAGKAVTLDMFSGLNSLKKLYLSGNIAVLPGSNAGLSSIVSFDFYGLAIADGALVGLDNVTEMSLESKLSITANLFQGLSSLQSLTLWGDLGKLPQNIFARITSLRLLNIYGEFSSLDDGRAFKGLSSLTTLRINGSSMLQSLLVPGMFKDLSSLKNLILMENDLVTLPAEVFTGLPNLKLLNLARNKITSIDANLFAPQNFEQKTMIYLGFSELDEATKNNIILQHGNKVAFDCGEFTLTNGWQYCPIQ